jgi:hypothetical protein
LLFANPYFPIFAAIVAIANAWELSLTIIIIGIAWLVIQGMLALPISIAVIIGFSIVAFAIYKKA